MNSSTILLIAGAVVMAGIAATTMSGSPASQSQSQSQPSYPPPVNNGYPSMGGTKTRRKLGGRKRRVKSRK